MTRRQSTHKEPIPCPFCRENKLQFTPSKSGLSVECPTCHALGPPAKGVTYGPDAASLSDMQALAIRLWNFRLDARTASWVPNPKWRCIECRVNWAGSDIGKCTECLQHAAKASQ